MQLAQNVPSGITNQYFEKSRCQFLDVFGVCLEPDACEMEHTESVEEPEMDIKSLPFTPDISLLSKTITDD